jgi:hypothetical protein
MRLGLHGTVTPEINLPQCVSYNLAELSANGRRRYIPGQNPKIAMKITRLSTDVNAEHRDAMTT